MRRTCRACRCAVADLDGRLLSLFATDERATRRTLRRAARLVSATARDVSAHLGSRRSCRALVSLDRRPASRGELVRARSDGLLRSRATGPSQPERVALHDDWPEGRGALRKDFDADTQVPRVDGHSIRSAGHRRRCVPGSCGARSRRHHRARSFPVRRGRRAGALSAAPAVLRPQGHEKRFERLPWRHTLFLAESISGDTAVGTPSPTHAIERLAGVEVPPRAQALRVVLLELERFYNHIADIGALATDVAFTVPASRAQAQREGLVRLYERLFGTRLLRGTIAFGGVKHDLTPDGTRACAAICARSRRSSTA